MEKTVVVNNGDEVVDLPPGFRFHPTDEEIIVNYLTEKVKNSRFSSCAIGEVDLNKCEPWDLPKRAKMGEKECYFFCQRDRKYPTGMRTNRATEAGYWKATGKDKEIYREKNFLVGMKKTLVFYKGRAPKGEKTNWVMHEYRLEGKFNYYTLVKAAKDAWVVCRVFHKSTGIKKTPIHELLRVNTFGDDLLDYPSPPPLTELPSDIPSSSCFSGGDNPSEIKGISSNPRSCDGNYNGNNNYFPQSFYMVNNDHMQVPTTSYQKPFITSNVYNPQVQVPNPSFNNQNSLNMPNYNFQSSSFGGNGETILRAPFGLDKDKLYKVEQFSSNQAMVSLSQDTGVSTDMNTTEISSVASKQEMGGTKGFEDLEDPSIGPISDLELWDCWSK